MKNFADYIPILVAVAYGLYHLFGFMGKNKSQKPKSPPPPSNAPTKNNSDVGWDDLLEALGQKEKPKSPSSFPPANRQPYIEPVRPKVQAPYIPPLPKASASRPSPDLPPIPGIPSSAPISESYEFYQPTIADASELKFKKFDSENALASQAKVVQPSPAISGMSVDRFRRFLGDRERLREAIVLNEILGKPVALR